MRLNKNSLILFLILLLSVFLRLNIDTFLNGYNYDELAIIAISKLDFLKLLKYCALEDYHAPLYYLLIHPFINFENNFIYLRILNIILSLINIIVFYHIGKLLINKKTGLLLALILAINHEQIANTNFIKFYIFCFLIISGIIYYLIKIYKKDEGYYKLGILNALLCLSNTFGIVFVLIEYIFLAKRKINRDLLNSFKIAFFGFLIYSPILLVQIYTGLNNIISPHGSYPSFSMFGLYNFLNDWFSPLINYSANTETIESMGLFLNYLQTLKMQTNIDYLSFYSFLFLSFIPTMFSLYFVVIAVKNNKFMKTIFKIGITFFVFFVTLVLLNMVGFIPIYIYPFGIILLISLGLGVNYNKNKTLTKLILGYIIFCQLFISNVYPIEKRKDINKPYGSIDKYIEKIDNKTPIIAINAGRFLKHYFNNKNVFSFDYEEIGGNHSKKYLNLMFKNKTIKKADKRNIKELLKEKIIKNEIDENFKTYLEKELFSKINQHGKLVLIYNSNNQNLILDKNKIEILLNKKYSYLLENSSLKWQLNNNSKEILSQTELGEVIASIAIKNLITEIEKQFKLVKVEQFSQEINGKYTKINEIKDENFKTQWILENNVIGWIFVTYEKK